MAPDTSQSLANLRLERDAILLYDALAEIEKDPHRANAFTRIAANERRHAEIWAAKLREAGVDVPPAPTRPRPRVAVIVLLARVFGTKSVSDLVTALCFFGSLAYSAGVGLVVQNQNRRLRANRFVLPHPRQ